MVGGGWSKIITKNTMEKTIRPEKIVIKQSASGKEFMSIIGNDDEPYQVWDSGLYEHFSEGIPVRVKINVIKNFKNITDVIKEKEYTSDHKERDSRATAEWKKDHRGEGMARGACFNKACDIVIAVYQKGDIKKTDIVESVEKYFKELQNILVDGSGGQQEKGTKKNKKK